MKKDPFQALHLIGQTLFNKKGYNILALDVREISTMTDYFIIAEGSVDKHVSSLGQAVIDVMKENGEMPLHVEGIKQGDWVVIDYLEIVIHLFMPGLRERYRLEELWKQGKIVDLEISIPQQNTLQL